MGFAELKKDVEEGHGKRYFEHLKEKEAKLNAELEAANAARMLEEKEDHDTRKLPNKERLRMAEKQRLEGNDLFKAGSYPEAILRYQKAQAMISKMFDVSTEDKVEADKISVSCHLNTAQSYTKSITADTPKDNAEVLYLKIERACTSALEIDATSVKALFRKAVALEHLGEIDEAMKTIKAALKVDEENADCKKQEKRLEQLQARQLQKQKKMYGKMFG